MASNTIRQRLTAWLLPSAADVRDFEIKPEVEGDSLRADPETLRRSQVVRAKAAAIRKQFKASESRS